MRCEFSNCKEWRGVKECCNNEGYFRLCKKHRKRANSPRIRKYHNLTELKILKNTGYDIENV